MRTVTWNPVLSGLCTALGAVFLWVGVATADVTADRSAGIIVWPKLRFDSRDGVDTEIQLSNTSSEQVYVRCFYVNANSHCSNRITETCNISDDCDRFGNGGICLEGWIETDFSFTLTANQPIVWNVSTGLPFFPLDGLNKVGPQGQSNGPLSSIPPAPEDPFQGELKCIQVAEDDTPTDRNDLKGEATVVRANYSDPVDARGYNALGIQAIPGNNDGDNTLILGGRDDEGNPTGEYNGCPNILILDHFFDDAVLFTQPDTYAFVRTHVTFVPCSQNFLLQDAALFDTTLQFLVFNEFEQRFSASRKVRCFKELELSTLDLGPAADRGLYDEDPGSNSQQRSIFNVNVQGTLTGHTRIRPVDDGSEDHGNGFLAVAEEFHRVSPDYLDSDVHSAAFQVHHAGERADVDIIQLP